MEQAQKQGFFSRIIRVVTGNDDTTNTFQETIASIFDSPKKDDCSGLSINSETKPKVNNVHTPIRLNGLSDEENDRLNAILDESY